LFARSLLSLQIVCEQENDTTLSPIVGLEDINPDYYRLSCSICGQRNGGACAQVLFAVRAMEQGEGETEFTFGSGGSCLRHRLTDCFVVFLVVRQQALSSVFSCAVCIRR
jgi:hypothetical protein